MTTTSTNYLSDISNYTPINEQETTDKSLILSLINAHPQNILSRENQLAHLTSSGFILNKTLTKALFVHHHLYQKWAWTGGHADNNPDLLAVAIREAQEETGLTTQPLFNDIAAIDVLPVRGHVKKGHYVPSHLHLSVAYVLIADDTHPLQVCPEENSAVQWFPLSDITPETFGAADHTLYQKLIIAAQNHLNQKG